MFYELNTLDPMGSSPWKRSVRNSMNGTFDGSLDVLAEITLLVDPHAKLAHEPFINDTKTAAGIFDEVSVDRINDNDHQPHSIEIPNILPDG